MAAKNIIWVEVFQFYVPKTFQINDIIRALQRDWDARNSLIAKATSDIIIIKLSTTVWAI